MTLDVHGSVMPARNAPAPEHLEDLVEAMHVCNAITENLQRSHDVLEAKVVRLQEELASKNRQLQRSKHLAALGQMAAGIAHEVRNPLQAIQLYAGMIADDLNPISTGVVAPDACASARGNAGKIASAVHGLDGIVCDVLRFAGEIRPRRSDVTVSTLVERVLESLRPLLATTGVRVEAKCASDAGRLMVDPDLMHQALVNLVRNAIEAMTEDSSKCGDRPPVVRIKVQRRGPDLLLWIADDGPGIPPEALDRIFDPFYTTRSTGTGLGLTIVHRIIDAHGGAIRAVREGAAEGATFEIRLPSGHVES